MSVELISQITKLKNEERALFTEMWAELNNKTMQRNSVEHKNYINKIDALDKQLDKLVKQAGLTSKQYSAL